MSRLRAYDRRIRPHQALVVLFCTVLTAYFSYHAISGRNGLGARWRLVERAQVLERELTNLDAARAALKLDVALLRPELPHPDMVEEIARTTLGYVHPSETILLPANGSPASR